MKLRWKVRVTSSIVLANMALLLVGTGPAQALANPCSPTMGGLLSGSLPSSFYVAWIMLGHNRLGNLAITHNLGAPEGSRSNIRQAGRVRAPSPCCLVVDRWLKQGNLPAALPWGSVGCKPIRHCNPEDAPTHNAEHGDEIHQALCGPQPRAAVQYNGRGNTPPWLISSDGPAVAPTFGFGGVRGVVGAANLSGDRINLPNQQVGAGGRTPHRTSYSRLFGASEIPAAS